MASLVTQRTQKIGVRMALGAMRRVFRVPPHDIGVYTVVGAVIVVLGLAAAWAPARRAARRSVAGSLIE